MAVLPKRPTAVPVSVRDIASVGRGTGTVAPGTLTDAVTPKVTPSGVRTAPVQLYFGSPTAEAANMQAMEIRALYYGALGTPDQPVTLRIEFQAYTDEALTTPDATAEFHVNGLGWDTVSGDGTNDLIGNLSFLSALEGPSLEVTSLTVGDVYVVATFPRHYTNRGFVLPNLYTVRLTFV